jgi:predicted transcriptional regulator
MMSERKTAMKAKEIMSKPVLATTPRASVRDIATQLVVNSISGMPVADRKGTVLGIVTEADVLEAVKDGQQLEKLTATEVMSKSPVTVDVEVAIEEVIKLLVEGGFVRVPVTENGKLVGIISRVDVIKSILEPEFMTFGA